MFDFFREVSMELRGIDVEEVEAKQKAKLEEKRKNRIIFPNSVKVLVYAFGVLYFLLTVMNVSLLWKSNALSALKVFRYVFLCSCDIGAMVFISLKTKKSEIIAGILIAIFLVTLYTTLMI